MTGATVSLVCFEAIPSTTLVCNVLYSDAFDQRCGVGILRIQEGFYHCPAKVTVVGGTHVAYSYNICRKYDQPEYVRRVDSGGVEGVANSATTVKQILCLRWEAQVSQRNRACSTLFC